MRKETKIALTNLIAKLKYELNNQDNIFIRVLMPQTGVYEGWDKYENKTFKYRVTDADALAEAQYQLVYNKDAQYFKEFALDDNLRDELADFVKQLCFEVLK